MKKFEVYSAGLVYSSVCTNLKDAEATEKMNAEYPTGIKSQWVISKDKTFATGEPHPCECPNSKGCRHVLFEC